MDKPRKNLVSLRGASVKEITRDALLEKVAQERELRNYSRRATSSAILIQRVWRGNNLTRKAAKQLREEWESQVQLYTGSKTKTWISIHLLRPFLFFITPLLTQHCSSRTRDIHCTSICFNILLESINAADAKTNFCSLATGNDEERRIWKYQSRKLISLCLYVLRECNISSSGNESLVRVTSLAMRLAVMLSDVKGWKSITKDNQEEAIVQVRKLVQFMEIMHNSLYINIRRYICKLDVHISSEMNRSSQTDAFVITASAVTLALRPFHIFSSDANCSESLDLQHTAELYSRFILTIPWLVQRLPAILLPALRHASVLSPCFRSLMIHKEKILLDSPEIDRSFPNITSQVGWALANIIYLVTGTGKKSASAGGFIHGLDYSLYVRGVMTLTEHLLGSIERSGCLRKENQEPEDGIEPSAVLATVICEPETTYGSLKMSYMDLFSSVYQQWHLKVLLGALLKDPPIKENEMISSKNMNDSGKVELNDIVFMYSYMVKIFSVLNPVIGSLPLLNMISFTPGFLPRLWEAAENFLFPQEVYNVKEDNRYTREISSWKNHDTFDGKRKPSIKDGGNRWAAVLHKISGKSQNHADSIGSSSDHDRPSQLNEDPGDLWDVEPLKLGPQNIHKEMACLLHLFCASYSHLLLVLDDIEFYEKQVPFSLVQQRRITSMLNTLVYNGLSQGNSPQNRALMDAAIRCLHLLYQRDCRHQFCPPDLWLAPGRKNRPPVAAAARAHEVSKQDATLPSPSMGSVITVTPHVFPFEERVQMFREFINMDKSSRLMAGEVTGRRARTVEIEVRRSHIVEDGFRQLNSLGPGLKSSIHVSFVSDCGLPEAGLDYGGLSKEFLTDIAKAGFSPEFGLFTQTATSDRLIVPNTTARFQENGIQMIEFLGKVVGKALYEGILLEYSFSHVFVQKLLGRYSFLDELSTLDPELYKNLMYVKNFDGDVTELSLDFTVTEEYFGRRHTVELKPGGKDVIVTNENKLQYVHAMADYKLNRQMLPLSNAFYRGLSDLISPSWLKLFNASEFNQLLSGGNYDIDVEDLRSNTRYTGGYSEGNRTIKLFWEVMTGLEPKERCLLLKFVTSCSRAPLLGFKHLQPAFTIHKVACDIPLWAVIGGQDVDRLPSASTCYNTLKLPTYKRSATLREKLLYAISSNAGFELS